MQGLPPTTTPPQHSTAPRSTAQHAGVTAHSHAGGDDVAVPGAGTARDLDGDRVAGGRALVVHDFQPEGAGICGTQQEGTGGWSAVTQGTKERTSQGGSACRPRFPGRWVCACWGSRQSRWWGAEMHGCEGVRGKGPCSCCRHRRKRGVMERSRREGGSSSMHGTTRFAGGGRPAAMRAHVSTAHKGVAQGREHKGVASSPNWVECVMVPLRSSSTLAMGSTDT